jgi:hypothetical protein
VTKSRLRSQNATHICGKIGHRDNNCWTLEKHEKKREAASQLANPILTKLKYATMTTSAITTALITDEQVSVMMKKVMASLKEKDGNNKKTKRQVHFSVLVIVIVIAIVAMIKNLRTKRIFPTHLHTLFYLIKLGLWKCRCTQCKMVVKII